MTKVQLWQKIKADWPELAQFLIALKENGMPAEKVEVYWDETH